jgi:hypothetical protein
VRAPAVGIYLTYDQFQHLTSKVVVNRLILRRQYNLASRICEYFDDGEEGGSQRVAVHWACHKVKSEDDMPDGELCALIVSKLKNCPGGSFVDAASEAHQSGRPRLAVMLLDHEACASDQVPLLIKMKEEEQALVKAIESGDTNLSHLALLHLQEQKSRQEFFRIIRDKTAAQALYAMRARGLAADGDESEALEALKTFYYGIGRATEAATIDLKAAYQLDSFQKKCRQLGLTMDYLNQDKGAAFTAKATDEHCKLLQIQNELELNCDGKIKYIDTPLADTIARLLEDGSEEKKARRLKDEFKVTDKRYAWIKLRAHAATRRWNEIDKMAKEKKSPIGYEVLRPTPGSPLPGRSRTWQKPALR